MQVLHEHLRHCVVFVGHEVLLVDLVQAKLLAYTVQRSAVQLLALLVARLHHRPPQLGLHRVQRRKHALLDLSTHPDGVDLLDKVAHAAVALSRKLLLLGLHSLLVVLRGRIDAQLLADGGQLVSVGLDALLIRLGRDLQGRSLLQQCAVNLLLLLKDGHEGVFRGGSHGARLHQLRPGEAAGRAAEDHGGHSVERLSCQR
mmetsp:Transcript_21253/g.55480  ORF Transcript_21253/g.55480 Transcript_21253/m.55480 type:complete len:201 (+) Transcript_21253:107-709(+)